MFLEFHDVEVWNTIKEGPFLPTHTVEGVNKPNLKKRGMNMINKFYIRPKIF